MKCRPFTAGAVTRQSDAELRKRSRGGKEMREIYEWSLGSTRPRGSEAVRAVPPNTEINQSCAPPPTLGSPPTPSAPSQGCGGRHEKKHMPRKHIFYTTAVNVLGRENIFLCVLSKREKDDISASVSGFQVISVTGFSTLGSSCLSACHPSSSFCLSVCWPLSASLAS